MKFDITPLLYGLLMATIDLFALSGVKYIHLHKLSMIGWMILPTLAYALQPWIFLSALNFESLVMINIIWDVMSDILVTCIGIFYFKEKITNHKMLGFAFAIVALLFFATSEDDN